MIVFRIKDGNTPIINSVSIDLPNIRLASSRLLFLATTYISSSFLLAIKSIAMIGTMYSNTNGRYSGL